MAKGERLPRLLRLMITIQSHPGMTAEQKVRECGVGKRQIFRDFQDISFSGAPIYNDNGYRFMENFSLQNISFSLEEALTLLYGLKLMGRRKALYLF